MPSPTIGFFGLGAMGGPIASRLAQAGYEVAVADTQPSVAQRWRDAHPPVAHDPASAAIVITCVTDEPALVRLLLEAAGLLHEARAGQLFIDHTTTSPGFARQAAVLAARHGAMFVDAPLSGGASAAQAGKLSVFAGGHDSALAQASAVMKHYAQRVTHLGPAGAGQIGKLANQIAIAGTVRGLTEAVALARAAALDVNALLDALSAGSARSNQLEQHADKLAAASFAFADAFQWLDKDLHLALNEAIAAGTELAQTALIHRLLRA